MRNLVSAYLTKNMMSIGLAIVGTLLLTSLSFPALAVGSAVECSEIFSATPRTPSLSVAIDFDAARAVREQAKIGFAQEPALRHPNRSKIDLESPPELFEISEELRLLERIQRDPDSFATLHRKNLRVEYTSAIESRHLRYPGENVQEYSVRIFFTNEYPGFGTIVEKIIETGLPPDQLVIRFFSTLREDLVRKHGTDRYGINENDHRRVNWDSSMRNRDELLSRSGNTYQDALYASPLLKPTLALYHTEFLLGRLSIAIYDKRLLNQHDFEYYTFSERANRIGRTQALVGIVRSPIGNERIRQIGSPQIKPEWYGF